MCVLALAWRAHPRWRLVVAANRDELHARPSEPLGQWDQPSPMYAGRDLQSGGSWLGVSIHGRFAAVTNLRGYGAPVPDRISRGSLVIDTLAGTRTFGESDQQDFADFNPFNLIAADGRQARFVTNRPTSSRSLLAPGIDGLSNGALDEPWPKTTLLKEMVLEWMFRRGRHPELLLENLADETMPEVGVHAALPSDIPQEPPLSSIFIRNAVYGTRCSTVVAVDQKGQGVIIERRYSTEGDKAGETSFAFNWTR